MRNVIEQYSQAENQLTHALFSTLEHDRNLLVSFLTNVCFVTPPTNVSALKISVQQYPFAQRYTDAEIDARNLPDAWVYSDDGWGLVFEAKIAATLTQSQLNGHRRVAIKRGFELPQCFTIVGDPNAPMFDGWRQLRWLDIYRWLRYHRKQQPSSNWAEVAADFFEILEAKMLDDDKLGASEITTFSGFFFSEDDDYSYLLAKAKLKRAMRELRKDQRLIKQLVIDPAVHGRGAITGKTEERVWDYLSLSSPYNINDFTKFMHLTLGITATAVEAMVTVPDRIATQPKNSVKALGIDGFKKMSQSILQKMTPVLVKEPAAVPTMRAVQRRYPTQRSVPYIDALLEFDLRTAFDGEGPKKQIQWIEALFEAFERKKSNCQFQFGVVFDHAKCVTMRDAIALDLLAMSWIACKPLVERGADRQIGIELAQV